MEQDRTEVKERGRFKHPLWTLKKCPGPVTVRCWEICCHGHWFLGQQCVIISGRVINCWWEVICMCGLLQTVLNLPKGSHTQGQHLRCVRDCAVLKIRPLKSTLCCFMDFMDYHYVNTVTSLEHEKSIQSFRIIVKSSQYTNDCHRV